VKIPETSSFLKKELIDFEIEAPVKEIGDERDEISGGVTHLINVNIYAFNIFEKVID